MDSKWSFLNGYLHEEVYVKQTPIYKNIDYPNLIFKLHNGAYGLKEAPGACYEILSKLLLENDFKRGKIEKILFTKQRGKNIFLVLCVDDILFGATNESLCKVFSKAMRRESKMSMMEELNFFLGLEIK